MSMDELIAGLIFFGLYIWMVIVFSKE